MAAPQVRATTCLYVTAQNSLALENEPCFCSPTTSTTTTYRPHQSLPHPRDRDNAAEQVSPVKTMTTHRRSERLRRKARQSTPGLSKPGAYTLYGSGYVVESEASFATSSQFRLPQDSRRARYAESPHCLQLETSDPVDEPRPRRASLLDAVRGALPDVLRRRAAQAYDAIAASPLARRRLRAEDEDDTDEIVAESDDEGVDAASQPSLDPLI